MRLLRSLSCACALFFSLVSAHAGTVTFPGENEFVFSGWASGGVTYYNACAPNTAACHTSTAGPIGGGTRLITTQAEQVKNGAAVRGSNAALDPSGTAAYHFVEMELHTGNFFTQNPDAHIVVAPRAFLPYVDPSTGQPYNAYPPFALDSGIRRPHAYGNGFIFGKVPCNQGLGGVTPAGYQDGNGDGSTDGHVMGIAIEHFLGPVGPATSENKTACPGAAKQLTVDHDAIYALRVFVRQQACPTGAAQCRWVGYSIQRLPPVFGSAPLVLGGNDWADDSQPQPAGPVFGGGTAVVPPGWSALKTADVSSWFIAHVFTNPGTAWSFRVKNVQFGVSDTPPVWWTGP